MVLRFLVPVLLAILVSSCEVPRDPNNTLTRIRGGILRVGVIHNAPWAIRSAPEHRGAEVALVRRFAAELNAHPLWIWGGEHELINSLEQFQLDLVIGGLVKSSPWGKKVGFTRPFHIDRILVGTPPSTAPLKKIRGVRIAVGTGHVAAAYLEKKKAIALPLEDPFEANLPVAASQFLLEKSGFTLTSIELHREEHVMAAPPGENAFLMQLENFLHRNRASVKTLLLEEKEAP